MIDSHCHLNDETFRDDLAEVLTRAFETGVRKAVVVGYDLESSRRAVELAQTRSSDSHPELHACVGVSTHEAASWSQQSDRELRALIEPTCVVGLGGTGFDF